MSVGLQVAIGAGPQRWEGWVPTDRQDLDLTSRSSFEAWFGARRATAMVCEHVWEHLDLLQGRSAVQRSVVREALRGPLQPPRARTQVHRCVPHAGNERHADEGVITNADTGLPSVRGTSTCPRTSVPQRPERCDMTPELQQLSMRLAEVATTTTFDRITDQITLVKQKKQHQETANDHCTRRDAL